MFSKTPLVFVREYLDELDRVLRESETGSGLTAGQRAWLGLCLMGILVTNSVCWARFERASLGGYSVAALSWMFRHAPIRWDRILECSVRVVLRRHGISSGVLVIDDSDKKRSKATSRIHFAHKLLDKSSSGYVNGQCIVFLILVSPVVTLPVGFAFYMPDPVLTAWSKNENKLKKQGVACHQRPAKPKRNPLYPTKCQLALNLLRYFKSTHSNVKVNAVVADALYGNGSFMEDAQAICSAQVISQLRKDQNSRFKSKTVSLEKYFTNINTGILQKFRVRGGEEIQAWVSSARLYVEAHGKKRFVIALKYENESDYRYLVATDLSWRTMDIVQTYSLRWLVEVFFEDWKSYEGWGQLTKQPDEDGSSRGLILSLLLDHCLLLHPIQLARLEDKLPAATVGSLRERVRMDACVDAIRQLLEERPSDALLRLQENIEEFFPLASSTKHMASRDLGTMDSSPSLARFRPPCAA